jgi:23S rRNA (cytosine1962-C5)-methyltransferase
VVSVDLDEKALAVARENASLNRAAIDFVHDDVYRYLRALREGRNEFDVVVLDPAKMTVSRDDVDAAIRKYADLNRLAMRRVRDGGLLLTCSCTGLVSEEAFVGAVRGAAAATERELQILRIGGAGPDHPVAADFPEGRYLKAVLVRVKHAFRHGAFRAP